MGAGYYEDDMINEVYLGGLGGDMFDYSSAMGFDSLNGLSSSSIDDESSYYESSNDACSFKTKQTLPLKRHLSVLLANRQIYNEASDLLRSELTVVIGPRRRFGRYSWKHLCDTN